MEEFDYVAMAKANNREAMEVLINNHHRYIRAWAKFYAKKAHILDRDDFFNEGVIGLMRAVVRCNLTVKTKFLTYAGWFIRNRMHRALIYKDIVSGVIHDDELLNLVAITDDHGYIDEYEYEYADIDFSVLDDREKDILHMFIIESQNCAEIGRHFDLTREMVRRIKNQALEKLRAKKNGVYARLIKSFPEENKILVDIPK